MIISKPLAKVDIPLSISSPFLQYPEKSEEIVINAQRQL